MALFSRSVFFFFTLLAALLRRAFSRAFVGEQSDAIAAPAFHFGLLPPRQEALFQWTYLSPTEGSRQTPGLGRTKPRLLLLPTSFLSRRRESLFSSLKILFSSLPPPCPREITRSLRRPRSWKSKKLRLFSLTRRKPFSLFDTSPTPRQKTFL